MFNPRRPLELVIAHIQRGLPCTGMDVYLRHWGEMTQVCSPKMTRWRVPTRPSAGRVLERLCGVPADENAIWRVHRHVNNDFGAAHLRRG